MGRPETSSISPPANGRPLLYWVSRRRASGDVMSDVLGQTDQRTCRFPGCVRVVVPAEGVTGRPPEYCDDPGHTRAATWRARRRLTQETTGRPVVEEDRPVDAARQRASEIRGQVAGMGEHLVAQLHALVDELRTLADPDAAEAQIEAVKTDAAERVTAASARASRAEQAQRKAEAERAEADDAAVEASALAEQLELTLLEVREQVSARDVALESLADELAQAQAWAEAQRLQAEDDLAQLRREVAATRERLEAAEQDPDAAAGRAEFASSARAEAEERARGAVAAATTADERAQRAEIETATVREQLDLARSAAAVLQDAIGVARGELATAVAERDGARAEAERERAHGDQRVADLGASHEQQLGGLRQELTQVRGEASEQRSRADRAEARQSTPPVATSPPTPTTATKSRRRGVKSGGEDRL